MPELINLGEYSKDRFVFRTDHSGNGIVIRPNEFLASEPDNGTTVNEAVRSVLSDIAGLSEDERNEWVDDVVADGELVRGAWLRFKIGVEDVDVIRVVRGLRQLGIAAQPNHVYFANSLRSSASSRFNPNMFAPNMFAPNMFAPNMFAPNMFAPNMFAPNMFAGGMGSGGCCCPGALADSETRSVPQHAARPVPIAELSPELANDAENSAEVAGTVEVHIIDVVTPRENRDETKDTGELVKAGNGAVLVVDENGDGRVDPAVGHGDFVKSVVDLNSSVPTTLWNAAGPMGDIDDACLVVAMKVVAEAANDGHKILNLSLSGYNEDDRPSLVLADQVSEMIKDGWLIVASAGNNASCRLAWPAALPDVVAVGAISKCAPAWFSNFGPWVDVSAPGVDVVARFPKNGAVVEKAAMVVVAPDDSGNVAKESLTLGEFDTGWVKWSGTSFSAPFVAAKLAEWLRENDGQTKGAAVEAVIHNTELDWLPNYGRLMSHDHA